MARGDSRLSLASVKGQLRAIGMTVNKSRYGEYRVNFSGGTEATAYYTTTLDDALATGIAMASEGRKPSQTRSDRMMNNPSAQTHVVNKLVTRYLQTGKGGRSGPWAVEVTPGTGGAVLMHYSTAMLSIVREPPSAQSLSTGRGSVSDQAGVNAAIHAVYGWQSPIGWFHRDRRGGGPRVNPRRNPMARYRRNPGGKSSILPMLLIGGAAFLLLRPGMAFGNTTTPPAVVPPGYTFVPGRGLVSSYQVPDPQNQLISAGIGAAVPLVRDIFGRVFDWATSPDPVAPVADVPATSWGGWADILGPSSDYYGGDAGGL